MLELYRLVQDSHLTADETSVTLDIREDGVIDELVVDFLAVDSTNDNTTMWELSFGSSPAWNTNDTRHLLAAGGTSTTSAWPFDHVRTVERNGVAVYAGERLYLHTKNSATPDVAVTDIHIKVAPKGGGRTGAGGRDSRGRYVRRGA